MIDLQIAQTLDVYASASIDLGKGLSGGELIEAIKAVTPRHYIQFRRKNKFIVGADTPAVESDFAVLVVKGIKKPTQEIDPETMYQTLILMHCVWPGTEKELGETLHTTAFENIARLRRSVLEMLNFKEYV